MDDYSNDETHKSHQTKYDLTKPCATCPFRNDRPFHLGPGRVLSIKAGLTIYPFNCHHTVDYDGTEPDTYESSHCAGALILLEKLQRPSLVMRMAQEFGKYDPSRLDMKAPVYDSFDEMISGCESRDTQRSG